MCSSNCKINNYNYYTKRNCTQLQLKSCKCSQQLFTSPTNKNYHNYLQSHMKSTSTRSLTNHLQNFLIIRSVVVTTYCKFIAAQKGCAKANCLYCERWIPDPLWRNYRMRVKSESSQPWLSESIVTLLSFKPHAAADCWRQKAPS